MTKNVEIEFKKAIFTSKQIIIKKRKQNIIIPLENIEELFYAKCSLKNYLLLGIGERRTIGALYIYLKEKINGKKMYCFFIKYENLSKIPKNIYKMIHFFGEERPLEYF